MGLWKKMVMVHGLLFIKKKQMANTYYGCIKLLVLLVTVNQRFLSYKLEKEQMDKYATFIDSELTHSVHLIGFMSNFTLINGKLSLRLSISIYHLWP